jgi:MoaA/NifB/PqqE/SkfB family radical SAM enzyme
MNMVNESVNLKYDVEGDWILLESCNFRCNYCFISPVDLAARVTSYGTNTQWVDGFEATGKTWLLHVTGGEPSIYPGFADLCERLTRNHYLSLNSNLAHRSIDIFADRINPKRVHFIHAAAHYEERQKRAALDRFIGRVHKLRTRQFSVFVSLVMTPEMVRAFPEISAYFESNALSLIPKAMRGKYQGRKYPAAYSSGEKALIRDWLSKARRKYASVAASMSEAPTIDILADGRFLNKLRNYRGKVCGSGYNFVKIEADGTVLRCGSGMRLGNILQKNVSFLTAPTLCDSAYCPYYCEKYTSRRFARARKSDRISFADSLSHFTRRLLRRRGHSLVLDSATESSVERQA